MLLTDERGRVRLFDGGCLRFTENDAGLGKVVRRQFNLHFVTGNDANKVLSHLSGDVGQDILAVGQIHTKHGSGQDCRHGSLDFNGIFLGHAPYYVPIPAGEQWGFLA